jgi:hypothetical protein
LSFTVNDGDADSNILTRNVTVTPVNDAPVISSNGGGAAASIDIKENTTAVTTVVATDADGTTPSYSIVDGADKAEFQIDGATGVLSFITAPDFEVPTDSNADNAYEVVVRASDGSLFDDQTITVQVQDVNNDNAPVITSNGGGATASIDVNENTTEAVTTVVATDADGTTPSYSIVDGADKAEFTISATGVLSFITAPDFEAPTDSDADNAYEVVVRASDGTFFDDQAITVNVQNLNDNPPVIFGGASASVNVDENTTVVTKVRARDADGTAPTYVLAGGADQSAFQINATIRGGYDDYAGWSVSTAGDVNGDGFADLIVGAPNTSDGSAAAGEAYLLFGGASGFGTVDGSGRAVIDLTRLSSSDGFAIQGGASNNKAGASVSAAGDVNSDGFDDLIVGAPEGGAGEGEAYVLFGAAFGASDTPVNTTGTAGDDILMGGVGDDTLTGGGGADVLRSGAGDDTLTVSDLNFRLADGGSGTDTLVLEGSGASFDFTALADSKTESIETVDFTGSGDNTLKLGVTDAINLSDELNFDFSSVVDAPKAVVIEGDAGDTLELAPDARGAWTLQASDVNLDGSASGPYDIWSFQVSSDHYIKLAVDHDVGVTLL